MRVVSVRTIRGWFLTAPSLKPCHPGNRRHHQRVRASRAWRARTTRPCA